MPTQRVWTPETAQAWREARDKRLESNGLKPFSKATPQEKENILRAEKGSVVEAEMSVLKSQAWPVGKHPVTSYAAPFSGVLLLPKTYHGSGGMDKMKVRKDDDLNWIVYKHYEEAVNPKTYPGENYVSKDGMLPKRHEYLGPSPRIASYRFTGRQIEIEWWEEYIKDTWIGKKKWTVEAEFDEIVEGWFVKDRNDY